MYSSKTSNNTLTQAAKALLTLLFLGILYKKLFIDQSIIALFGQVSWSSFSHNLPYFGLALLLIVANWSLETYRWRSLLNARILRMLSLRQSFEAVLSGVTLGLISPARLGEYAGRLLGLKPEERTASLAATLMCSMTQMLVTILFGLGAYFMVSESHDFIIPKNTILISITIILVIGLAIIFLFPSILKKFSTMNFFGISAQTLLPQKALPTDSNRPHPLLDTKSTAHQTSTINLNLQISEIPKLLSLSITRYLVYSLQYILILYFFGVQESIAVLFANVSLIFLLQTLVPLPAIMSIVARGSIAVMVLSFLEINELLILISALTIWMMNLVLPALVGIIIILRSKAHES